MFAMSLAAYNAWGSVFTFITVVAIFVAIISLFAFLCSWAEMYDNRKNPEGDDYRFGRRIRLVAGLSLPVALVVAVVALLLSTSFNTEFHVRKDTTVPQRVDRSEIKVDSNAPTGVIVDGRSGG